MAPAKDLHDPGGQELMPAASQRTHDSCPLVVCPWDANSVIEWGLDNLGVYFSCPHS